MCADNSLYYTELSAHTYPVHYNIPSQDSDDILNFGPAEPTIINNISNT